MAGLEAGLLAASATAGALVGFGVRDGAPGRFLAAAGQAVRGVPSFVTPDRTFGATGWLGVAQHIVVVLAWAVAFAALAGRLRGAARWGAGLAGGVAIFVLDRVLPDAVRFGGGALTTAQRAVLVTVLALSLVAGLRLADGARRRVTRPRV